MSTPSAQSLLRAATLYAQACGTLTHRARRAHTDATKPGARGPTLAAWAGALGVSRATLARWRAEDSDLRALPLAQRGGPRRKGQRA